MVLTFMGCIVFALQRLFYLFLMNIKCATCLALDGCLHGKKMLQ
jgi:hypothetical protein